MMDRLLLAEKPVRDAYATVQTIVNDGFVVSKTESRPDFKRKKSHDITEKTSGKRTSVYLRRNRYDYSQPKKTTV
ncbi:hypothetical protein E6C50_12415 [Flavobacterium supellecticarium]|uniref:Uncharacterized protein n=1 Tax=Flavobacterium supellecticarium TaxID=2565924 RepID=A0A4S3ZUW9_9FLAO|nr:hypothetical protein [Flavobacterium supellecticarium]THF49544.1 hypothetical protein E6C50_12415 [Flavobacterium supellecticarium]